MPDGLGPSLLAFHWKMRTASPAIYSTREIATSTATIIETKANWKALDGLRGWAIIFVMTVHLWAHSTRAGSGIPITLQLGSESVSLTWIFATGHNAVIVFFALSGFLLYRHWLERQGKTSFQSQCRSFFESRARRILPGYLFYMMLYLLLMALLGKHRYGAPMTSSNFWLNFFFLTPIVNFRADPASIATTLDIVPGSWSLNAEMWFYAGMPLLALWLSQFNKKWIGWILLAVATAASLSRYTMGEHAPWTLRYSIFGVFDAFLVGMGVAALAAYYKPSTQWSRLFPIGLIYYIFICAGRAFPMLDQHLQLALASGLMVSGLLAPGPSRWKSHLEKTWIVNVGHWSYGLFLSNILLTWYVVLPLAQTLKIHPGGQLMAFNFAVGVPLMMWMARTTFYSFEQPILRRTPLVWRSVAQRAGGLALLYVAAAVAFAATALHRNAEPEFHSPLLTRLAQSTAAR